LIPADTPQTDAPGEDHRSDLVSLQDKLGYQFDDVSYLKRALTHRSYLTEHDGVDHDNQRLEFLGDAVLGMVVAETLFRRDREVDEGVLSKRQSQLVRGSALADMARELDLGAYLKLGKGEAMTGGRDRESLLADAYEALLAAIYLDGGLAPVKAVIEALHGPELKNVLEGRSPSDFKSRLQEWTQKEYGIQPDYVIVAESGPAHDKEFVSRVDIGGREMGRGEGRSKQRAEQRAAAEALERLEKEPPGEE
jgi:ribonuclease-3